MTQHTMNGYQMMFLQNILDWDGVASSEDLSPQISQKEKSARQTCKRRGWVTFDKHYWRITDAGRASLERAKELATEELAAEVQP